MAKTTELYKVHSFTTSSNFCHSTTAWNTDASNYVTRWLYLYRSDYLCSINSTEGVTWFNNFVVL